jgi:hypothetical protein
MILLTGEKFTGFLTPTLLAISGFGVACYLTKSFPRLRPRVAAVTVAAGALLLISVILGYRRMGVSTVLGSILTRLANQGHVWFGVFEVHGGNGFLAFSDVFGQDSEQHRAGLTLLSYLVSREEFVRDRGMQGISFTMGGPPSALGVFGWELGAVVYSLASLLYVAAAAMVVYSLKRRSAVVAGVALGACVLVGYATQMGTWDTLYSPTFLAIAVFLGFGAAVLPWLSTRVPEQPPNAGRASTGTSTDRA